jgi:hypothetical protein
MIEYTHTMRATPMLMCNANLAGTKESTINDPISIEIAVEQSKLNLSNNFSNK